MSRKLIGLAVAAALVLAATSWADPPEIKGISPAGAQRGVATELTVNGANLKANPQLVAPFALTVDPATTAGGDAAQWKPRITVAPDVPVGVYQVRVKTDEGLSNPLLFSVGQLPQVFEKEENSTFETAQVIPSLIVVEGQAAGTDVDFFKFSGKKGQRIVVDAQCARIGSSIDPTIRLTTAGRAFVASADDSPGLLTDARLFAVLPEDTDYVIELSDSRYQGGGRPIYRLLVGPVPVAEEIFPMGGRRGETVGFELRGGTLPESKVAAATLESPDGNDATPLRITNQTLGLAGPTDPVLELESATPRVIGRFPEQRDSADPSAPPLKAVPPVILNGRIDAPGDEDRFVLAVTPGQRLRMRVVAADLDSALDGQLQVLNDKGNVLATADDTSLPPIIASKKANKKADSVLSPDPSLDFNVPAGLSEVTVVVRDLEGRGGIGYPYRLTIEPIEPTFDVKLDDAQVSVPRGGTVAVDVTVNRQGYTGPITLGIANAPAGLSVRPGKIAEGQNLGVLTLTASADAAFGVAELKVQAEGQGAERPIVRTATKPLIFAQSDNMPTNVLIQTMLPTTPAPAGPVTLEAPEAPVEIVHGFEASIPIKAVRTPGADAELALSTLSLPPGLTASGGKIAAKALEGTATVKATPDVALGLTSIAVTGKGKFDNRDLTFAAPAVTLNVIRPAALELATASAEIKAGDTLDLKGKIVRKGAFKEPVLVKINGLPAGLKAEPVTVAPDASEFTLKVAAEVGAAAATSTTQVVIAFQLEKKDYNTPPTSLALKVLAAK